MHIEPKDVLSYPKFFLRTIWQFISNPRAWMAVRVILWSFLRTAIIGSRAARVMVSHSGFNIRKGNVMLPWRFKTQARYIWRVTHLFWAPQILEYAKIEAEYFGFDNIDWTRPYVIAANHQSTIDILLLVQKIKMAYTTPKKELLWYLYIGTIVKLSQVILDRGNRNQTIRALNWATRECPNLSILFFIEGTRARTDRLGYFKKGAARTAIDTGFPIIPVTIDGAHAVLPTGSLLQLKLKHPKIRVTFGKPISVLGLTESDTKQLTEQVRKVIERTLEENKKKREEEKNEPRLEAELRNILQTHNKANAPK